MATEFAFTLTTTRFDEDYCPSATSRVTTNFANLARGEHRQRNLRNAITMINRRFNELAHWDNTDGDRYTVELDIISVGVTLPDASADQSFPLLEVLETTIVDRVTGVRRQGIVGNNFSSYVRDYDFSIVLPGTNGALPADFGDLHGKLFDAFVDSDVYRERFGLPPVVCISVSTSKTYERTTTTHPVLGVEYRTDAGSLTDAYFAKMGLQVRYFMPAGSVSPLAFYFRGDLLNDYTPLQLIGTISTMETFQKIYRPEIYNANSAAGAIYRPSLTAEDFSTTHVEYDREERNRCALVQGTYTAEHFITPHSTVLQQWASSRLVPAA